MTQLLNQLAEGDRTALDRLIPLIYRELHKLAKRYMNQQDPGHTLQTTAVINEAYLKLFDDSERHWTNREHFFGAAAKAMRQVLVDHARSIHAAKRGGGSPLIEFDEAMCIQPGREAELIALDDALTSFSTLYPRHSDAVELRYFGGLTAPEIAKLLRVSADTVLRDLRFAKTWLRRELNARPQP